MKVPASGSGPRREEMIAVFFAMEEHVSDCPVCRPVERDLQLALSINAPTVLVAAIIERFCPAQQQLAEQMTTIGHGLFGVGASPDVVGLQLARWILEARP